MSKKILICDDEENVRESLKLILADHYDLILCDSHKQCLNCLENHKDIQLLLLDIKMPEINGLETLAAIKEKYSNVQTVIITGYKSVEIATETVKHGACGYLTKPFKSEEVLTTAQKFLSE